VNLSAPWKQEVNRRVAAHMVRKAPMAGEGEGQQESRPAPGSRAAQLAARVAARYANAPSYSEMLANEARAAMQAAEAASRAAQHAQAVAQAVLDSLEAAASAAPFEDSTYNSASCNSASCNSAPAVHPFPAGSAREYEAEPAAELPVFLAGEPILNAAEQARGDVFRAEPEENRRLRNEDRQLQNEELRDQAFAIRWEPDMPVRAPEPVAAHTRRPAGLFESGVQDWPEPGSPLPEMHAFEMIEPAQPIHANLIEFPRELVATRKVRPRLADGPLTAEEPGSQLSIFEVDPGAISIEPEPVHVVKETASQTAPVWTGPEWSDIRLDAQPEREPAHSATEVRNAPALELAPASRRLLAVVVDVTLVAGTFVAAALLAASKATQLPSLRTIEVGSAFALLVAGALYEALFFMLARATPGMRYAQIRLSTFEGQIPTRAQRSTRLVALLLSVLPVGMGLGWALFDEDHLTWHDRLSRTYLRKN
jgi:uncharacterized RDD family membrane protein YckC